jgi:hypothetical protein
MVMENDFLIIGLSIKNLGVNRRYFRSIRKEVKKIVVWKLCVKFEALGGHCEEYYIWGILGFDFLRYVRNNIMSPQSDLKGILRPGGNNRILQKGKFLTTQLQILQNRVFLGYSVLCRPTWLPEILRQ